MKTIQEDDNNFICDIAAPCFHLLAGEELTLVRESKTQVLFHKGENLSKQGTFASYILFVMKGLVKVQLQEGDKSFNLRLAGAGEFLGLSTVFGKNTFNYSATALNETQAMLVEKSAIEELLKSNGHFAYNLMRRYVAHNDELYQTLRKLMYKQMNGRLAGTLLYLSSAEFAGQDVFSLLSRKDLGEFAGISTESTVKLLKAYERDGILKLNDKHIEIRQAELLRELAEKG